MAKWNDPSEWTGLKDGTGCPICLRQRPLDVIAELETSWITAPNLVPLPAYLCVVAKRHVVEPFDLTPQERQVFWEETLRVAAAVSAEFNPVKMNYEIHGNTIPHLHVHLLPRYRGDPFEDGPIDVDKHSYERPAEELARLKRTIGSLR